MARKNDTEVVADTLVEELSAEPRVYELGFHLDPELSQEDVKRTYQGVRDLISKNGTLVAEGEPEKVQLAYTISRQETTGRRDFDSAYFCWIAYEAAGAGHEAILEAAKEEKKIVRFLDIKTTKEEAKHSAEMQELRLKAVAEKAGAAETEDGVSEEDLDAALEEATVS